MALSLQKPKNGPKKVVMATSTTPEKKISELESKIQTREVAKQLSALKESAQKNQQGNKTKNVKSSLKTIAENTNETKKISARKSLINYLKPEDVLNHIPKKPKPTSVKSGLQELTGAQRLQETRRKLITMRHDAVLYKVKQLIKDGEKKTWDLEIDQEVSVSSRLRPDIYMTSPDRNAIIIADVTCPYEHGTEAMERAWENKVEKYEQGFNYLRKMGKKLTILPIVIGSLGTWWAKTSESLTELGIDRNVVHRTIPELCSIVLEYSKNCYWHHIFGDTYVNAPFKFGGEKPSGNDWKGKAPKRTLPPDKA
uniref:Uncharacterized protein n=1 Tax=Caenorhabditis japonica TaxID=281687 RepID=A0A8R1ESZ3_CAEJA